MKGIIIYTSDGYASRADMEAVARHRLMDRIIIDEDGSNPDWKPGDPAPDNTLVFTNCAGLENMVESSDVMNGLRYRLSHERSEFRRERRRGMLFPHVRYGAEEVERFLAMPGYSRYARIAFVRLFGWLGPSLRDRLGIR